MLHMNISKTQIIKGSILLFLYIIIKTVISQLYGLYRGFGSTISGKIGMILGGMFIVCTIFILILGFYWMRIPIFHWITQKKKFVGDIIWGIFIIFILLIVNMGCSALFISFNLFPVSEEKHVFSLISLIIPLIFRLLVIAPCEELLFRGFLQQVFRQSFGSVPAIMMQAVVYAAVYLGYYPLYMWFFILFPFIHGLIFGFIREKRGTCLPSMLGHALAGS